MSAMDPTELDITNARILLVDDVPANLDVLCQALEDAGYEISVAPGGEIALRNARANELDLILLDVVMPGMDGYETCRRLKADPATRDVPVIFITARGETEGVVEGFAVGGVDYIAKPFRKEEVLARVQTHLEKARLTRVLQEKNRALEEEITRRQQAISERNHLAQQLAHISQLEAERWGVAGLVARSPIMQQIFHEVGLLQKAGTTSTLIVGESGTGKELIARAIHFGGSAAEGPFIPVNCAAIPANLAESQFFGHVRGAFTGADTDRTGYFELADGGTLFLDEVGEMPVELQPKLLRALEDGRIVPVGGKEEKAVKVRTLAATNADLPAGMAEGAFRQDLYYRLARFTLRVPPLRQRREDIPLLGQHFVALLAGEMAIEVPEVSVEALEELATYDVPGNVRELKNLIERALLESRGGEILPVHLHFAHPTSTDLEEAAPGVLFPADLSPTFEAAERWVVERIQEQTQGNVTETARRLGVSRNRIYRILRDA